MWFSFHFISSSLSSFVLQWTITFAGILQIVSFFFSTDVSHLPVTVINLKSIILLSILLNDRSFCNHFICLNFLLPRMLINNYLVKYRCYCINSKSNNLNILCRLHYWHCFILCHFINTWNILLLIFWLSGLSRLYQWIV